MGLTPSRSDDQCVAAFKTEVLGNGNGVFIIETVIGHIFLQCRKHAPVVRQPSACFNAIRDCDDRNPRAEFAHPFGCAASFCECNDHLSFWQREHRLANRNSNRIIDGFERRLDRPLQPLFIWNNILNRLRNGTHRQNRFDRIFPRGSFSRKHDGVRTI